MQRRNILSENEPSELAIHNSIQLVEQLGADEKLTEAVILLGKAKGLVSDFIDAQKSIDHEDTLG